MLAGRPADTAARGGEAVPAEPTPVFLLRQRPPARYQLLGTVEAKSQKRRMAEARLMVRAAMAGADAVVDLQEEFLPDFRRTVRRLTGTAVRAVDSEGRYEVRSRWYADQIARVSKWALVLLVVCLPVEIVGNLYVGAIEQRLAITTARARTTPTPEAIASNVLKQVPPWIFVTAAVYGWPITLAALTRCLRWPQFVRPLSLTIVAYALAPVYYLTGLVAGALLSGGWSGLAYHTLFVLDPIAYLILMFVLFLGRAAWRADREFRRLVPGAARKAPPHRAVVGGLTVAASVTYAAVLVCYFVYGGYLSASNFRLPTNVNWIALLPNLS